MPIAIGADCENISLPDGFGAKRRGRQMATYNELTDAAGKINASALMRLALQRARSEQAAYKAMGWTRKFSVVLSQSLIMIWCSAKAQRDAKIAAKLTAAMTPNQRNAQMLELNAELAESAIPARRDLAIVLRASAAALRGMEA